VCNLLNEPYHTHHSISTNLIFEIPHLIPWVPAQTHKIAATGQQEVLKWMELGEVTMEKEKERSTKREGMTAMESQARAQTRARAR